MQLATRGKNIGIPAVDVIERCREVVGQWPQDESTKVILESWSKEGVGYSKNNIGRRAKGMKLIIYYITSGLGSGASRGRSTISLLPT
jgi:hypothetical protein